MLMFIHSCHLLEFAHFQFTLIHGPNIPGSYAILFFTELGFTFTTRHTHSSALFPLWLRLFILSGAISPLFSSSILDIYQPGEFSFQPQDWKRSVFISIPNKGNAKECSNYCMIALISHASKVVLKILQASLLYYVN